MTSYSHTHDALVTHETGLIQEILCGQRPCCLGAQVKHFEADRQSENRDQLHCFVHRRAPEETIEYEGRTSIAPEIGAWMNGHKPTSQE